LTDDFEFPVLLYSNLRECDNDVESLYDLFEYNPWQDVAVDTPVYVSSQPDFRGAVKRHFAKFANGVVYVWEDGRTSWTTTCMVPYRYAKFVNEEGVSK